MLLTYIDVCIFCKDPLKPIQAYDSLCSVLSGSNVKVGIQNNVDNEGRAVIVQFTTDDSEKLLSVINVYCPHLDPENIDRAKYKDDFLRLLKLVISELIASGRCANQL